MHRYRQMDSYRLVLPDAVDAIIALILDRWIPPPTEVDHMIRGGDRQAEACGLWRQDEQAESKGRR